MAYDITILTDRRYTDNSYENEYDQNVVDEDRMLLEACQELGLRMHRTNWDNPDFDWSTTQYIVFRTTWDYFERFPEFSKWLDKVSQRTTLINSKELIYWNLNKRYLIELEEQGVRIPPTKYIPVGTRKSLKEIVEESGWAKCILKPAVSGAARHTYKFEAKNVEDHTAIYAELIAAEDMMLQEFQDQIVTKGEVSYILFGGKYSHSILKMAKKGDFRVQDDFGGTLHDYDPSQEEIAFAEYALSKCAELPAYARVDVFWDNDDNLVLGELELIEPELWFRKCKTAAVQCAEVLRKTVKD